MASPALGGGPWRTHLGVVLRPPVNEDGEPVAEPPRLGQVSGFLSLVSPNRRLPDRRTTEKTIRRSSSTRSLSSSVLRACSQERLGIPHGAAGRATMTRNGYGLLAALHPEVGFPVAMRIAVALAA